MRQERLSLYRLHNETIRIGAAQGLPAMARQFTPRSSSSGPGPAGYTAAIYAARAMLDPVLIQGMQPGGQLTITTDVENYPGFADVIQGPWLMEQMEKQAEHVGTKIVTDMVVEARARRSGPFRLTCDSGDVYLADTVILATGAQARWLGLPSEEAVQGLRRLGLRHLRRLLLSRQGSASWSAAATPPSRKRCSSPISPPRSRWSIAAIISAPSASCRIACSRTRRSR